MPFWKMMFAKGRPLLRDLATKLVSIWAIVTLTFILMKCLPGDPFTEEKALPTEIHQALMRHYGLDKPLLTQYGEFVRSICFWDLGPSYRYPGRTVNSIIYEGFPISALLGLEALALAVTFGVLGGTCSALYRKQWPATFIFLISSLAIALPSFLLATSLQYFLSYKLGLLPVARWGSFAHTVIPAIALAAAPAAFIARLVRSGMGEVLKQDFINTARMKGLSEVYILRTHVMRNTLLPVVTYLGPLTANILTGSFIIEKIFAIPGLGQWFVNSILTRDYTVITGLTIFYSVILMGSLALVEMAYSLLDPRIKARVV